MQKWKPKQTALQVKSNANTALDRADKNRKKIKKLQTFDWMVEGFLIMMDHKTVCYLSHFLRFSEFLMVILKQS